MSGHWARGYLGLAGADQNGGGGGGGMKLLNLTVTETSATLDATYAEVKAAMQAGTLVGFYMIFDGAHALNLAVAYQEPSDPAQGDQYFIYFNNMSGGSTMPMGADTEDGQLHSSDGD